MREVVWVIPTVARGVVVGCVDRQYERLLSRADFIIRGTHLLSITRSRRVRAPYKAGVHPLTRLFLTYIDPQTFELLWSVKVEEKKHSKYLLPF